ncbi:hypothetical protein [Neptunicella marina]|uniref:hypothetical protein n=1 Tax=Neptunicella marina TaxID=2125989 RepID=UPI0019D5DA8F|nr:hypothetical protein [Neptunicella marina]
MQNDIILFDINETVLNLASLKPKFEAVFGSDAAIALWFSKLLHSSTVCIATEVKTNFAELASTMLDSVATHYGCRLTDGARSELLAGFASLSAHADIEPSLKQLRSNGFKTVAFSNSSSNLIASQIENAGLTPLFD